MQATCYLTDTTLCTSGMFAGHRTSGATISHHTGQCNVVTPSAGCPLNRDYDTIRPWVHCTTSCVTINAGRLSHHVLFSGDDLYLCLYLLKPKGQIDTPEEFVMALNSSEVRGDKRYEVISALRVALTNNPVS